VRNFSEFERWLADAKDCLQRAERCFRDNDWRGVVQNSQIATELSAKALISLFEEPAWTHKPDEQLKIIIESRKNEIKALKQDVYDRLIFIADDVGISAPWHGWSVYGREVGGRWVPAVELCTKDTAGDLIERARRTLATAEEFYGLILKKLKICKI
jgi:hypothetical protein